MKKKAQVIIISLWIMLILSLLAISSAYRVSLVLRTSSYQKKSLESVALAKSGIYKAISIINSDPTVTLDTLGDNWADSPEIFSKVTVTEDPQKNYAIVSYVASDENPGEQIYGVSDEERLININTADQQILESLLENCGIISADPQSIASAIRAWRDSTEDTPPDFREYNSLGYPCKGSSFVNVQELILVKSVDEEILRKIEKLITVYGSGNININTASAQVLNIVIGACNKMAAEPEPSKTSVLADSITSYRKQYGFFHAEQLEDLCATLNLDPAEYGPIVNELKKLLVVQSNNFRIIATGVPADSTVRKQIEAVYNRSSQEILFYHQI